MNTLCNYLLDLEFSLYNYLGEDLNIFKDIKFKDCWIFGGFIRDVISKNFEKINDIDIICDKSDSLILNYFLCKNKWSKERLDKADDYAEILGERISIRRGNESFYTLSEVLSYKKNNKEIQLIIPTIPFKSVIFKYAKSVDMTASAIVYNIYRNEGFEVVENAIEDCENKKIILLPNNIISKEKTEERVRKLIIKKGWAF